MPLRPLVRASAISSLPARPLSEPLTAHYLHWRATFGALTWRAIAGNYCHLWARRRSDSLDIGYACCVHTCLATLTGRARLTDPPPASPDAAANSFSHAAP